MRTSHLEDEFSQCCSSSVRRGMSRSINRGRWELDREQKPSHLDGSQRADWGLVWCSTDIPQGNDNLALHRTNKKNTDNANEMPGELHPC